MLKRIQLENNQVYTIKISDEIYGVVQHRENNFFEIFDIFFTKPDDKKRLTLDLNIVPNVAPYQKAKPPILAVEDFFVIFWEIKIYWI